MYSGIITELKNNDVQFGSKPFPFWQIEMAKNGKLTASEIQHGKQIRLHSSYNPEREAQNAINQNDVSAKGTSVFLGFGLGYHVIEWAKKYAVTDKKLVVIEPDPYYFFTSLLFLDWTEVFKVQQLIIVIECPPQSVFSLLEPADRINMGNEGVSDCYFFDFNAFTNHADEYFETLRTLIKRNLKKNEINAATLKKFGKLWKTNSEHNKCQLEILKDISEYEGCMKQSKSPFILAAAGPSLQKAIPEIKKIMAGENAKLICVETSLHILLKNEINPDFIILSDPQFWAYRHIAGLKAPESILITDISAYPAVFRFECREIRLMASQFPIAKEFEKAINKKLPDLGTGGTVASVAWNFAYYCGAKEIITAGLDFSFPGKQTHVKGSSAEQTYFSISNRIKSINRLSASAMFSANPQTAVDYNGNEVITDSKMKMFAWWFESRIAACCDVKCTTICCESMKIPGIEPRKTPF